MSSAQKFVFGTDFREGGRRAVGEADLAAARAEGFQAGQEQARRESDGQVGTLLSKLARSADMLVGQEGARATAIESQAAQLAILLAQRLAGAALADRPQAAMEAAIRDCLAHARLAPHLVVRVHETSVEAVEGLVRRLAHEVGFAGKLVVLPELDIAAGDGRIEWADGGVVIDSARLERLAHEAVQSVFGPIPGFAQNTVLDQSSWASSAERGQS